MFSYGNFAMSLIDIVNGLLDVYSLLILLRAVLSWFSPSHTSRLFLLLYQVTEPVLSPLRRIIPLGGVDFSP